MSEHQTFNRDTLYEITNDWFDNYRCEVVEQLVKREISTMPEDVGQSADMLNAAESYAWDILRKSNSAFGLRHAEEEQIAGLLAEWAQVGRYADEIAVSEKQAARELSTTQVTGDWVIMRINGDGITNGQPGDMEFYSDHKTQEEAIEEMNRLNDRTDQSIYTFDIAQWDNDLDKYVVVEW